MSDVIGKGVIEVSADASKLKAGIEDAKKSIRGLGEASRSASESASRSIDRYVQRLQTQAVVQGKSTREAELYRLGLRGASVAQLAAADSALRLAEGYERGAAMGAKLRSAFLALGTAAATGLIAATVAFDHLVKKAGDFQDMAEKTGDTAVNIASLAVAAGTAGVGMDTVVGASTKLTKGLTGVDDESKAAGAAVAALGLNLKDFKNLQAADQFEAVAKALAGFEDGAEKTAVAMALFGKSGADLLPFLKELGQEGGRQNILTAEQIRLADEYSDKQAKLRTEIGLHAQAIATSLLPAMNDFAKSIADIAKDQEFAATASTVLKGALSGAITIFQTIAVVGSDVAFVIKGVGRELGGMLAQLDALGRWDFKGFTAIGDAMKADADKARAELERFQTQVMSIGQAKAPGQDASYQTLEDRRLSRKAPGRKLTFNGAASGAGGADKGDREAQQVRKAELDRDIKTIRDALQQEQAAVAFHERYLQGVYRAGEISLKDFYDTKRSTIAEGASAELHLLERERARLEQHLTGTKDPSERVATQTKIDDVNAQVGKVRLAAARDVQTANQEEAASFKALNDQVSQYRANLLELQGDETGAARLRVSFAVDQAKTLAKQSQGTANPITDEQVQAYAKVITQQTQLNTTKSQTSFINQRLAIEEERIALAQRTGSISEIAALGKLGDARARAVSELEKQIAEMERIAKVRPLDIQLQIDTAQARLQLDSIKAELDPLKAKFDETFRSVGENFFSDLMNGKKPKDALTSFFGSIASEIKSVVSKQLSQQVFGKDGVFGGAGGMLSELFGGKKGDPAKPTIDTSSVLQSFSTLQTAGIDPTVSAFKVLAEAAQATAVTLSNIKGTDLPLLGGQAITPEETEDIGGFPMLSSAPRRDGATTGESAVTNLFRDASRSSGNLTDSNADATNSVLQLAKAAAKGSESLSGLPRIISAVQVLASAAGGSSGSNPGSLIGKVLGMAVSAYNGTHTEGFKYSGGVGYGWDQGFAKGGYTGDVAPDKKAGVVHGQEFVFSAPAVKAIGRSTLERAHREASAAPFFHSGGVVGRAGDVRPVPSGVFAHAGKYHTGGIVGQAPAAPRLAENEVPAFLMGGPKGVREEVLTANDPRHKDNLSPAVLAANERGVFALSVVAGVGGAGGQGGDARSAGGFASTSVTSDSRETDRSVLRESVARTNIASATNTSASDSVSVFTQAAGAPGSNGAPGAAGVAAIFQLGGIVGRIGVTRSAPVSIFQGAAKYHAGGSIGRSKQVVPGLEANEVPAILLKNEEVLTAKDPRHRNNLSPEMARVFNAAPRYHAGGVAGHTHDTALLAPAGSQYLNAGTAAASKSEPSMQGVINNYTVQVNATPGMTTQQAMNQGRDLQRGMQAQAGRRARNN